jgi:hypothetical protein
MRFTPRTLKNEHRTRKNAPTRRSKPAAVPSMGCATVVTDHTLKRPGKTNAVGMQRIAQKHRRDHPKKMQGKKTAINKK